MEAAFTILRFDGRHWDYEPIAFTGENHLERARKFAARRLLDQEIDEQFNWDDPEYQEAHNAFVAGEYGRVIDLAAEVFEVYAEIMPIHPDVINLDRRAA